ncbi:MAG: GNAT family N-acetyltransferase [Sedimentisphaerales bacterium]|nr:GNAT family N-acetyltransferase [Sedimentisphaerales bacterium]
MPDSVDICVRQVQLGDAEAIVRVLNPIIEAGAYTILDAPLTAAAERRYIMRLPERAIFHVAQMPGDGAIVGLQTLEPFVEYTRVCDHVGVIATFVALECRRQGVGARLFEATFDSARQKGYEKMFTYVRGDNRAALNAYLKQGFRIIGTSARHAKIGGRYIDEVIIEKFL